ncbi:pathogenicity island protein [Staphylococcus haemolyticus]|uniref:pathogenicity island protein n=1 Tax=Staphylococcus haemolyticus TaxID=1283 RepID=UPI002DB97809|nr:pathogenicity island protein [Staphylococcus haemolyticus]MEB6265015.1 pathogenicity island protein [Staphylococcus haemolyticus]
MEDKIIQIIPAPENLYVRFINDYDTEINYIPIVCIALTSRGFIRFCDTNFLGVITETPLDSDDLEPRIVKYNAKTDEFEQIEISRPGALIRSQMTRFKQE